MFTLKRTAARSADAVDAGDPAALQRFFDGLPVPIDHVVVTVDGGRLRLARAV